MPHCGHLLSLLELLGPMICCLQFCLFPQCCVTVLSLLNLSSFKILHLGCLPFVACITRSILLLLHASCMALDKSFLLNFHLFVYVVRMVVISLQDFVTIKVETSVRSLGIHTVVSKINGKQPVIVACIPGRGGER